MFGASSSSTPKPAGLFSINTATTQPPPSGGLFGGGGFGASSQPKPSLFGNTSNSGTPFGGPTSSQSQQPQQSQTNSIFGPSVSTQPAPTAPFSLGSLGGQQQQQQNQQAQQDPARQTLRFGKSQQQEPPQIWHEGRGLSVYRTVPAQMNIIKDKWDPNSRISPLRQYLYNYYDNVNDVAMFQPLPDEDAEKWEEAVTKRPDAHWVPTMTKGFYQLGKRVQKQKEFLTACNIRLREINDSIDAQLERHSQKFAPRIAECRRKHAVTRKRTLALAAKIQILRNRGYVMDNAEEELKEKLLKLEREVFDPSLNGREQEIWARMLGIKERGNRLKAEMEKLTPVANGDEPILDEDTTKSAKKALEAYDTQLRHLQKELQLVQQEFADFEKISKEDYDGSIPRR